MLGLPNTFFSGVSFRTIMAWASKYDRSLLATTTNANISFFKSG